MGQIIELPNIANLKREIQQAKKSLEDLLLERDELRFVVCQNIKTNYMLEIGNLEYRVYKEYCDFLRLRRKKEIIQAKQNRKEKISMKVIERLLDEEFLGYKKKLEDKIHEMNEAMALSKMESLTDDETQEFKKIYRSIVKSLHPDLNPEKSEAEKQLFINAAEAYRQGDLATLQIIFQMLGTEINDVEDSSSFKWLQKEKEKIQSLVKKIKEEIEEIKKEPPYIWKIYLDDENKKEERIAELKKDLKSFQEAIRTQEEYIDQLMRKET